MEIKFSFEPWNPNKDQRTLRAATSRALAVIDNDLQLVTDQTDAVRKRELDPLVNEVCAIMAECIDWLRANDIPAAQIESKVKAAKRDNLEQADRKKELTLQKSRALNNSDPFRKGESLSKSKKPREV